MQQWQEILDDVLELRGQIEKLTPNPEKPVGALQQRALDLEAEARSGIDNGPQGRTHDECKRDLLQLREEVDTY
jgi:hypothetical protein